MVGSEAVAVCDILIFKNIAFFRNCLLCLFWRFVFWVFLIEWLCGLLFVVVVLVIDFAVNWWDSFSCLFVMFCFERIIDWEILDCFFWLFDLIDCSGWLFFVERKKNYGRTAHCNAAVVKTYVKMSAIWFKRLIFWFGCVLFVVKTFSCSERRFASDTS